MVLNTEWAQVEVIDLINDGSGLAFGIIGGRSTGVVVKTILPGGVADRDGRLQSGDHILQIGEVNLRGLGSEQVASVLRQCGVHVRMVVARPIESAKSDYQTLVSQAPIVPTKILGDPVELDRHLIANGYAEAFAYNPSPSNFNDNPYIYSGHQSQIQLNRQRLSNMVVNRDPLSAPYFSADVQNNFSTMPMLSLELGNESSELPETETFTVELKKDDLGLGITVAGYVCEKEEISGIFVKSISKGSAADLTNSIRVNDRIVEVDGTSVIGYTNHQAVELLRNSGPVVTIQFERYLRGPKFEQLQQAILANEMRLPSSSSPTLTSLLKVPLSQVQMDYLSIDADGESRTSFEFDSAILLETMSPVNEEKEIVIGGEKRFLQFTLDNYDSIYAKWRKKLEDNAEVVIAQLQKDSNSGLGISLEGTVDVEDGREVRPHHYIRNILPEGPVGKNGILQSGDELLEVNGVQLLGLNHLEVVSILKQLPNYVSLVCARYPSSIRIIDTSQHREAFQARKILAGSLQTLIPLEETTNHLVKSKSETSIGSSVATEPTRSKSLEIIVGIPMWSDEPTVIELIKGDRGLGFSILDYQDPLSPQETVIVVRSLVPGGVAYADGRLIPGDRLLAVNGINIEHATLNVAVQVLKWVPKGTVTLTVAKPLNMNDTVSHTSQDTEEDQTGLEDFQECIEEFQECLDVVHICIEAENSSFSHSPTMSHMEEILPSTKTLPNNSPSFTETNCLLLNAKNLADSDIDVSFKSISDAENIDKAKNVVKTGTFAKTDSLTQSDRPSDGYETCLDESLSEDNRHAKISKQMQQQCETESYFEAKIVQNSNTKTVGLTSTPYDIDDLTPTNSRVNILTDHFFHEVPDSSGQNYKPTVNVAVSEPCLSTDYYPYRRHICLEMKLNTDYTDEDGLKSYDNQSGDFEAEDEFFLVQYPRRDSIQDSCKSKSDPNVLENYRDSCIQTPLKKCLKEYYNDFSECLEAFSLVSERKTELCCDGVKNEMCDDDIFNEILLPFKSQSTPDIADSSFVMLTYDPGPDLNRRKSAAVPSCKIGESEMTVIRPHETDLGGCQIEDMLQKHWGSTHTVKVYREPNKSLGISIVGGKVDLHSTEKTPDRTLLGIFVKHVVPNSPAGKTGQFKTGDRILEVSGIDLKQATHEKAVQAIRNASNPVTFVIQSLIPWKITNDDSNKQNQCQSPYPSPVSSKSPPTTNFNNRNEDEKAAHENHQKETLTPNLITPNAMGLNTKNLSPIVTQTTPMHSPKRSQSALSESVLSPSPTSDLEVEKISHRGIESGEGSEDEDEDEEDVRELEGRTVTDKGQMIDRASAGNVKRTKDEIAADLEEEDEFGYTTIIIPTNRSRTDYSYYAGYSY